MTDKPHFVFRDGMTPDSNYVQWIADIKSRYRSSQIKAAIKVNTALLEFYWSVGRDLVALKAEERWGSGIVKQFALDMRNAFPDAKGFSDTNVKYMKRWYLFYYEQLVENQQSVGLLADSKEQQPVDQLLMDKKSHQLGDQIEVTEKGHQLGDILEMPDTFGLVPWKQHILIISMSQSVDEALFYINQVIKGNWSRARLETEIHRNLYRRQGAAISNFSAMLPTTQGQLAQEILKDPYNISFLGRKDVQDEKELEDLLEHNITRFLLELGQGFAYVGRQMELQMPGGQTYFPDLVFYHIHLKCYVVVELKVVPFKPEFVGKINFYVSAADELLKRDDDNPSIGLIICRSADKTTVEWSFRGIDRPLGVASYQLEEVVARTVAELEQRKKER